MLTGLNAEAWLRGRIYCSQPSPSQGQCLPVPARHCEGWAASEHGPQPIIPVAMGCSRCV